MAKQKVHKTSRSRKQHAAYWLLLLIGLVAAAFALQAIALWLPWRWAFGFASNATVWPLVQLSFSITLLLVAAGLFYLMARVSALVFGVLGLITMLPVLFMFVTWSQYGHQHQLSLDVLEQRHMTRSVNAPDETFEYGRAGGQSLMLSAYFNPDMTKRSPAIVYVHGGGWSGGSRTENGDFFRWLSSLGYSVFSIDYRYATSRYASWRDAPADVVCALAWLNETADTQHIDRDNVAIMGDSAGGQLALRAAYGVRSGDVSSSCQGEPLVPKRVIGIVPAIDARELYDDPKLGPTSRVNIVRYLGGTPETAAEAYNESSVITHVKAGLPPTLIINAANDTLVSPDSGERLAEALDRAGVEVEQYTLPYAAHSYWINPGGLQNQMSRQIIERFLVN